MNEPGIKNKAITVTTLGVILCGAACIAIILFFTFLNLFIH